MSKTISVLIPAYNEEKSICRCVNSCLNQTRKPDEIIIVNDGSTDNTLKILKSFGNKIKIVDLKKNTGNKSKAQEMGLREVKTDVFITTDADTSLDKNFVKEIGKSFDEEGISAVCGFVKSDKCNWITNVREINYLVGQTVYKKAQSKINAIFVLVGCGSAFKTSDFRKIVTFDHDNVTEDLDFTYKLKLADKK
ncbi:MAG: glycosyltransferase family 2 protein, partial [Candidatus Falkowbacteria bacterium]|nr:glycosyltransferase family 2 protein [Candidatus Falkowbacteria bacterium]